MELWQLDVTGSVFLADGTECKLISGIDDHSRFCVIATAVRRATGPFASVEDAQAAVDVWREEYNHRRPHQSLDMACQPMTGWSCGLRPTLSPSPPRLPALRITR
jgi:transposase InsO family protein